MPVVRPEAKSERKAGKATYLVRVRAGFRVRLRLRAIFFPNILK